MHDVKAIRDDPEAYRRAWASRGVDDAEGKVQEILGLDATLRATQTALQAAQSRRNDASKLIGAAKAQKNEARAAELMAEVEQLKTAMAERAEEETVFARALKEMLAALPNLPADDVPDGADEHGNVEQRRWGTPPAIDNAKDHVTLGEQLGLMDFEAAARMSGARFVAMKGQLARLERALGQFMLDTHTGEFGYTEVSPPLLVRDEAMFGTGQLPKFRDDQFATADGRWLIPTAEVSLTNLAREQIIAEDELPWRLTALTPCFRLEAGASGRDTRGIIRQHQFWKCELVSVTAPEQSNEEHERMTACAEAVLQRLGLAYRVMLLCKGDMGFSARKTFDIEVWLPSQGVYREISSCSNCGDFQARRMDARARKAGEKGTRFVHSLNGSGLAVGRTLVAILENYQDENGRIAIPDVLHPYMRGMTHIES
jgi:seryl-tRNA synthetase